MSLSHGLDDEAGLAILSEISAATRDAWLCRIEAYALEEAPPEGALWLVKLLVERGRFEGAAQAAIRAVKERDERRSVLWTWWDRNLRNRSEEADLRRRFTEALLVEFERGPGPRRRIVSELFGKGDAEARLPLEEFKRAIGHPR